MLDLDLPALYTLYGRETGAGAAEPDPEAGGRARFSVLLNNVRARVCADPRVKSLRDGGGVADRATLAAVLLESLASYLGHNMPPLPTAAVLIVKLGLDHVCKPTDA